MFYWIYDIPTKELALLIAGSFVLFYWAGCFFVRPILRQFVRARTETNAIVGNVLSCHGVFYGLLLGLLAVAAYQNYVEVESNVSEEAAALATLYENFHAYPEPNGQYLRWLLRGYCRYEIEYSWPLQQQGIVPEGGRPRIIAVQEKLLAFKPQDSSEQTVHAETLRKFNEYLERRRMRLQSVQTGIPAVMWYVVLVGAVVNLAILWLLDMKFITQLFLGGLVSFFLGSMIFLVAEMDNPFRGELSVQSTAFQAVHALMMEDSY